MSRRLLNTHLAYLANRGYVFVDYIARDHPPFPDTLPNGTRHMLHIPMNAFTSGPTGGGSWEADAYPWAPRAISQEWWDAACPEADVIEVSTPKVNEELNVTADTSGEERLLRWAEKLRDIEGRCVRVVDGTPFDFPFMGTDKMVSIWPSYGNSPTLKEYAWSALIARALARNFALLSPGDLPHELALALLQSTSTAPGAGSAAQPYPLAHFAPYRARAPPIRGLLGLHVRRGDYAGHCQGLAAWGSDYNAWNLLGRPDVRAAGHGPALPDHLDVPPGMSRQDAALAHCWPSVDAIVQRARAVRASSPVGHELGAVYLATNGEDEWVAELAGRLRAEGYALVSSSFDMQLAQDERAVAQAVDMAVLTAAQVFIGNGFSSLSSNVVQLRLAGGRDPETSRFW
ncbi:hypothetical protein GGX14DRAFT_526712 [Mycena pura]|uniref:Uncharacterized protein n=1 Tax=Mycena pura TaxID=153505 RepID=A0AAD6UX01_9AGAR|nr:hypothetical protein GGX14DRAFT_526712 [Mycena pura]